MKKCRLCSKIAIRIYCEKHKLLLSRFEGRERTREAVRIRDKYSCYTCRKKWKRGTRRFDVHHLNGLCGKKSRGYDKFSEMEGLITICHKCHYAHHEFNRAYFDKVTKQSNQRNKKIKYDFLCNGKTLSELGIKYGVSRARISQICIGIKRIVPVPSKQILMDVDCQNPDCKKQFQISLNANRRKKFCNIECKLEYKFHLPQKQCYGCKKVLLRELFYIFTKTNSKRKCLSSRCKTCTRRQTIDWKLKNPQKAKEIEKNAAAKWYLTKRKILSKKCLQCKKKYKGSKEQKFCTHKCYRSSYYFGRKKVAN